MIFFHTYSHSFLLFLSFIPFLSLSLLFSRYISSSQLSSCPCSPPYTSLDRSLSLSLSPSISFHVLRYISVPHFHYRSSRLCPYDPPNPHHSSFLPSNFPHPPLYRCIPLLALRLLPATHSPPSLSLTHTLSLSVSLYRTVSPVYASPTLSPFLTLFLSLSPPRVSSIVDLHFSWPFALLLPHECILSGIRRNVLAGVPLITV